MRARFGGGLQRSARDALLTPDAEVRAVLRLPLHRTTQSPRADALVEHDTLPMDMTLQSWWYRNEAWFARRTPEKPGHRFQNIVLSTPEHSAAGGQALVADCGWRRGLLGGMVAMVFASGSATQPGGIGSTFRSS